MMRRVRYHMLWFAIIAMAGCKGKIDWDVEDPPRLVGPNTEILP